MRADSSSNLIVGKSVNKRANLWLETGFIRYSTSSWCSRTSIVKKNDGSNRVTVYYPPLNAATIDDSGGLGTLATMHYSFKLLNLLSAYHQLSIKEADRHRTAFRDARGGCSSSRCCGCASRRSPLFSRPSSRPGGSKGGVERRLDDILLHIATLEGHLTLTEEVFELLHEAGYLKCMFSIGIGRQVGRAAGAVHDQRRDGNGDAGDGRRGASVPRPRRLLPGVRSGLQRLHGTYHRSPRDKAFSSKRNATVAYRGAPRRLKHSRA